MVEWLGLGWLFLEKWAIAERLSHGLILFMYMSIAGRSYFVLPLFGCDIVISCLCYVLWRCIWVEYLFWTQVANKTTTITTSDWNLEHFQWHNQWQYSQCITRRGKLTSPKWRKPVRRFLLSCVNGNSYTTCDTANQYSCGQWVYRWRFILVIRQIFEKSSY